MPTDGRYLTIEQYKQWARDEITVDDDLVSEAILGAESWIDNALARRMVVASASSARVYAPIPHTDVLTIDDCTTVTSVVENGATLTVSTDYQLEPFNNLSAAGETVPYSQVRRIYRNWYTDGRKATVTVTAAWGWAAIPPQVLEACKVITSDMLMNRELRGGLVAVSEVGGVGTRENRLVRDMVSRYRSVRSWGLA